MDGMSAVTDTHAVVKQLQEAGVEERQAEVIVHAISDAVGDAVTKADLAPLATKTEIAELRADLYRALWLQAAGIIGLTVAILRFFA